MPRVTRSLWFRATLASSLALAVALAVVVFTVYEVTLLRDRGALDDVLTTEGDAVVTSVLNELGEAEPNLTNEELDRLLVRVLALSPGSSDHLTVIRQGGREVSTARGPSRVEALRDAASLPLATRGRLTSVDGLRVRSQELRLSDRSIDVVTIGDDSAVATNARVVALRATVAALIGGGVGLAVLSIALHRSTRALAGVSSTVRRTRLDDLTARVHEPEGSNEVADLARDVNAMLDQLVRARRTRDELIASVSHELRTPLAAARGHVELMTEGRSSDPSASLERVDRELRRLTRLVDDLLALARASDPAWLAKRLVPVHHIFAELTHRLEALGVDEVAIGTPPDVLIEVDPDRLLQALSNLVVNAANHTPDHTRVSVDVSVDGSHMVFVVRDDGPGLPDEVLQRFGETFVRGSVDGTGLGLAVTRAVVVAHGGSVEVSSDTTGTAIGLRLPLDSDAAGGGASLGGDTAKP